MLSLAPEGDGAGVYVMVTLRLDFHMGSVECVTCHVPCRNLGFGGDQGETLLAGEEEGGRKVNGLSVTALAIASSFDMTTPSLRCWMREGREPWSGLETGHQHVSVWGLGSDECAGYRLPATSPALAARGLPRGEQYQAVNIKTRSAFLPD